MTYNVDWVLKKSITYLLRPLLPLPAAENPYPCKIAVQTPATSDAQSQARLYNSHSCLSLGQATQMFHRKSSWLEQVWST